MSEVDLYGNLMYRATAAGHRLFRNNVGLFYTKDGRPVRCGLAPGSSDLIGFTTVLVTPAMVGRPIALFTAIEAKLHKRLSPSQRAFLELVADRGGLAGMAYTVDDYLALIRKAP